jgi:uncharacterized protein YhaN
MRIRRLEISAFRCFRDTVVIDNVGDGVTLLVGDNEEGKSTVLAALQAILFEKHSVGGAAAEAMLPYGSKVRPEIKLEFDYDGQRYMLRKGFCQKAAADLRADSGERWSDDAAEERLREMLEFTPPTKGGAKADHRGLQALFWVEQGSAFGQPHINDAAQSSLAGALEVEVGTITGGERGRTLLRRIEARLNAFFTKTRKPTGAYGKAIGEAEKLKARHGQLMERLGSFEEKIATAERERKSLATLEAGNPLGTADTRLEQAQSEIRRIEELEGDLKAAKANLEAARSQHELAKVQWAQRTREREAVIEAGREVRRLEQMLESARNALGDAQRGIDGVDEASKSAVGALSTASKEVEEADCFVSLLRNSNELTAARETLGKAVGSAEKVVELEAKIGASSLTTDAVAALRQLDVDAREKETLLKGAATLIELLPEKGCNATIKGVPIASDAVTLSVPTEIGLDGYGAIRVTPGGKDLSRHGKAAGDASSKLSRKLAEYGVADILAAEKLSNDRAAWESELGIHHATVRAHAPQGLDTLRGHVARLKEEVQILRSALGCHEMPDVSEEQAVSRATEALQRRREAEVAERTAYQALRDAEAVLAQARILFAGAEGQHKEAMKKSEALGTALEANARAISDENLQQAVNGAAATGQRLLHEFEGVETELKESDPEGARCELKAAIEARVRVAKNLEDKRRMIRDLEVDLRAIGSNDLEADIEVAVGELARANALQARLGHEARAVELLHDALAAEEQVAREAFLAPIRDRIAPYLKRLLPGSDLVLDDQSLHITHLRRDGQDEPYERLSIGTREQLAVLARLAFADLLDEHGKKSPIILDDALVYSDDRRFAEMLRVLDRAAERLQILVLTCHERAYFDRGWTTHRLQEAKGTGLVK